VVTSERSATRLSHHAAVLTHELPTGARLRLPEETDAAALYEVVAANREHLAPWMPWAAAQTVDGTLKWIRAARRRLADNHGLEVIIEDGAEIVGAAGTAEVSWRDRSVALGYWLAEDAQGRGTMTAVVGALVDHAFGVWELNRVEIRAAPENARSRAIPERLGFTAEGTLRQVERIGDRYVDHVVYGLLAAEWRARQAETTR
jgi:ribosomal-protein-serine acetyltransferase